MKALDIIINTWMSYDPEFNKYYFGIGFDGLEGLDLKLEKDFVKDKQEATSIINQYDFTKELRLAATAKWFE